MQARDAISRFATVPGIEIKRSRFNRPYQHKTTFREGDLIPIYRDEILPGDTVSLNVADVVRMSTPIFPVMDNCFLDLFAFFVPNRLVWQHWREFMGENTTAPWAQTTTYQEPQFNLDRTQQVQYTTRGSVYDYFGLPFQMVAASSDYKFSALPFRAYGLIWNEWFRDQNLQSPIGVNTGDSITSADLNLLSTPMKANKYHDYFTSCLPAPQKGPSVLVPLSGIVPVVPGTEHNLSGLGVIWKDPNAVNPVSGALGARADGYGVVSGAASTSTTYAAPSNLWAKLDGDGNSTTINALRLAFQTQKLLERDAFSGSRYTEILYGHFGVTSPDGRLQRPEYLGGSHQLINMDTVVQSSQTTTGTGGSPQGNVSGCSKTVSRDHLFTHSFTEHGQLIVLACVRTQRTYQNGIERSWTRRNRLDYYWPELAHIGNQPVYNREIYADGSRFDEQVFGYQEAWAEYRYKPSHVTGYMRSFTGSLDSYHYADSYLSLPVLSDSWIREDDTAFKRTLAVQSSDPDQFIADFFFTGDWTRPMPVYSVPGMADHF